MESAYIVVLMRKTHNIVKKKCDSNYKTKLCIENEEAGENANWLVTLPKGNLALSIMNVHALQPRSSIYPR